MYFGKIKNSDNLWGFNVFTKNFISYVEIDDDEHMKIINEANTKGKLITGDKNGYPILIDPPPLPPSELAKLQINKYEIYLKGTDWYVIRQLDEGKEIPIEVKQKRHEAREEISRLRKIAQIN